AERPGMVAFPELQAEDRRRYLRRLAGMGGRTAHGAGTALLTDRSGFRTSRCLACRRSQLAERQRELIGLGVSRPADSAAGARWERLVRTATRAVCPLGVLQRDYLDPGAVGGRAPVGLDIARRLPHT